jgi:hypothetical protein
MFVEGLSVADAFVSCPVYILKGNRHKINSGFRNCQEYRQRHKSPKNQTFRIKPLIFGIYLCQLQPLQVQKP